VFVFAADKAQLRRVLELQPVCGESGLAGGGQSTATRIIHHAEWSGLAAAAAAE